MLPMLMIRALSLSLSPSGFRQHVSKARDTSGKKKTKNALFSLVFVIAEKNDDWARFNEAVFLEDNVCSSSSLLLTDREGSMVARRRCWLPFVWLLLSHAVRELIWLLWTGTIVGWCFAEILLLDERRVFFLRPLIRLFQASCSSSLSLFSRLCQDPLMRLSQVTFAATAESVRAFSSCCCTRKPPEDDFCLSSIESD